MKFDLDAVFIEHRCADSALAARIIRARFPADVPVHHVADAREVAMPTRDQFGAGKRTRLSRAQDSVSDGVSGGIVEVRVLWIPGSDLGFELSDGLLVLLPAGYSPTIRPSRSMRISPIHSTSGSAGA